MKLYLSLGDAHFPAVAYALIGVSEYREDSLAVLEGAGEMLAPDSFRSELGNVVWPWVKDGAIDLQTGKDVMLDAEALLTCAVPTVELWERALELSVAADHAAYDTLFVALAEREQVRLVTCDRKLLSKFPDCATTPR